MAMQAPHIGRVALVVPDLDRSIRFYEDIIGLTLINRDGPTGYLGAGNDVLLELVEQPEARPVQRATGLYHFAILLPSRPDLARTLYQLLSVDAPISGYADHAVSEAIYLTDPDGHGIEIYRDRPRSEWPYLGGQLRMTTDPLDLNGVLGELRERPTLPVRMPAGTMNGHIHLQVAEIAATEDFYTGLMGMKLMVRYGRQATFLAANGYHHHIGANTWAGAGLAAAPADAARLLWYEIRQPDAAAVAQLAGGLSAAGYPFHLDHGVLDVVDPSGIRIRLTAEG